MRLRLVLPAVLTMLAATADGQIIRRPTSTRPQNWVTGSVGLAQLATVTDGSTQSQWDFGDGVQFRVGLEHSLQGTSAIGVGATFARMPLTYRSLQVGTDCVICDADAYVTQLLATFHYGGSTLGFHQIINLAAGMTGFSSFRARDSDARIGPNGTDWDLTFAFGYGFGYALSPHAQVQIVQDIGTTIHQRNGLQGGESSTAPLYVTRIGIRYGLGVR